ncbi:hypothetical protein BC939DRAFT_530893 [Gamsiella multidivaricata]|uniref:uncharacterized protein n=1 Tax=Gamsiella multidivaricata TaxID=101098 RepID=UPI002220F15A|nr:uncharacterized protein BC939DRAFT_530893 [Gamsiella multidivaricata]KAG0364749.1 hypothetical protein BGZ54_007195 [Gamsiella multidivaricata]KAI7820068.1 hypothetical protein BC939DRAFT_530893 [Gamsiella multidivaricata]
MNSFKIAFLAIAFLALAIFAAILVKKLGALRDPLQVWEALNNIGLLPIRMRAWIFSTVVGFANPYSRSINFRITELRKGKACGVMKETKKISNPFRCVHAAALITFGETVGGLAVFTLLGKKDRAILTNINAEYIKVSRGLLTASSVVQQLKDREVKEVVNEVLIKNAAFETVAKLTLTWRVDLKDK